MENIVLIVIISLAVSVFLFFILRELFNWYWKINERISLQHKTNFLLEKITLQLGATNLDEITVEEISTGKRKNMNMDKWIEFKLKNPKSSGFRTVKSDVNLEQNSNTTN
jgi:hypothetical protein